MSLARAVDLRPEDLAGRRWAGYVRDSTVAQAARYGPDLQRAEQRRFAERYGLLATDLEYVDLVSGKDTLRRTDFARMLADADAGEFDVLLCYDTSRFARNVEDAYSYRRRLAAARVTIVFCADGLIAGNTDTYELEGLKTVADAAYIRRLSRNVARGIEQKWQLFNDPGGHAPLGFARVGERQLLAPVDGPDLERARTAFVLYGTGTWSDGEIADELGLTEAGVAEILTNPLYAGRVVRHKGRPDEEERPARFAAPVDPALFERVQELRAERSTRHPGATIRRSYPTVRLMRCIGCGSTYYGDANNGKRRIRHGARPACGPSASYRAERYEEQVALLMDTVSLTDSDLHAVLGAMRRATPAVAGPDPTLAAERRTELQRQLATGEISLDAFSRAWRALDRPVVALNPPDELRLARARRHLAEFGTLWRNPAVPDRLREEATREIFARFDVDGPTIVAAHPQANENAWLLGLAAARQGRLQMQQDVGLVGARGLKTSISFSWGGGRAQPEGEESPRSEGVGERIA
jgi:DNA invertase Pin-like site-specific DNA recombinase